jgi:hypothetical protein
LDKSRWRNEPDGIRQVAIALSDAGHYQLPPGGGLVMGFRLCVLVLCVLAVPCFAAEPEDVAKLIPQSCPDYPYAGVESCPPADWIMCPAHEGMETLVAEFIGMSRGDRPGPDLSRMDWAYEPDGMWLVCRYSAGPWWLNSRSGLEEFSEAIQIEGWIVQSFSMVGGYTGEGRSAGVSVARGTLKHEPVTKRAEDPAKDTELAGVRLGWGEEALRLFSVRKGYEWHEGAFADYVAENWGLQQFPSREGRRVTLTRPDGAVDVIFDRQTKRVREVLLHLKGKDVVQSHWRAAMLRFGPDRSCRGNVRIDRLERCWGSVPDGVIVQFRPKRDGWEQLDDEAFIRLADLSP